MVDALARSWGWVALRGVAALVFGLLTLFNPALTLAVLILFFGGYAIANGLFTVVAAIAGRRDDPNWVVLLISGILSIALGVVTFLMPGVTTIVLLYLIAGWAIITGVGEIVSGIRLRKLITGEWMLILVGVLSVLFGLVLIIFPGAGALSVVLWIGAYATVFGILLIVLAFRLRSWGRGHRADGTLRTA